MMNEENYKTNLVRMWDSLRKTHKYEYTCEGVDCKDCPLVIFDGDGCNNARNIFDIYDIVEKWSEGHRPKHKVSKTELDILMSLYKNGSHFAQFMDYPFLMNMVEKGYFDGASRNTYIDAYIDSCEVVDE